VQATDDDVRAFYDAHKDQIAGSPSFEDVKEKLKPYAEAVKQREALRKYLDGVRKAATVTLNDAWVAEQRAKAADNPLARALKTGRPVLVDFASANSEPCVQMAPTLKALAEEYSGRAEVVVVDIQQYPNVARRCGIESTPAQIFYDSSGKEVAPRHAGFMSREDMVGRLKGMGVE
jgi:thioredoxin 1